ncbi:MAG TPA: hypothetical protein PKE55_12635 [Kiritimatiellia bacterium]|nr:hypothetical protein [Kiritimatiellia bacterium]
MKPISFPRIAAIGLFILPLGAFGEETPPPQPQLASDIVAVIHGEPIPYDWFVHEFRSTFFRHGEAANPREAVWETFLKRALLYEAAKQSGLTEDPAVMDRIRERVEGTRAFMAYQLAMLERGLVAEQYLETLGLKPDQLPVSDQEVLDRLRNDMKEEQLPISLGEVPPKVREQIEGRIRSEKVEDKLKVHLQRWMNEFEVVVDQDKIDTVPYPQGAGLPGR